MKSICLYNLEQAGLVVSHPSGLTFFNLGGADGQKRLEVEGFFVPISNDPMAEADDRRLHCLLADACRHLKQLTPAVAGTIDGILQQVSSSDLISVDRRRLNESLPGWVYVTVCPSGDFSQLQGLGDGHAVLTWPAPSFQP